MSKPTILVAPIHTQTVDEKNFKTGQCLAIIRAYEVDGTGRVIGHVPDRVFAGVGREHRDRSGVVFRSSGAVYAHFNKSEAGAVLGAIQSCLNAAGYTDITHGGPAEGATSRSAPKLWTRVNRGTHALAS
jgi:hypothetical protein